MAFWKPGAEITFQVPAQTFPRRMPDGTVQTVQRKPFIRRSARKDAWRYHLREMALAEEPLRYIRRYLNVEEDLTDVPAVPADGTRNSSPRTRARPGSTPTHRGHPRPRANPRAHSPKIHQHSSAARTPNRRRSSPSAPPRAAFFVFGTGSSCRHFL